MVGLSRAQGPVLKEDVAVLAAIDAQLALAVQVTVERAVKFGVNPSPPAYLPRPHARRPTCGGRNLTSMMDAEKAAVVKELHGNKCS